MSIKIIDKSSGLIVSEKTKLSWTREDKKGNLINPGAFVVVQSYNTMAQAVLSYVTGDWNVRIKPLENGKTSINVNLVNIKATNTGAKLYGLYEYDIPAKSTGVFEKTIAEQFR